MATRKERQADLLFKLGLALSPLYDMVEHSENYDATARSRAVGKFAADYHKLWKGVYDFTRDDPGHDYEREFKLFEGALNGLQYQFNKNLHDVNELRIILDKHTAILQESILAIPALTEAVILEARTPFSSYCLIKDLCQTTGQRLILTDRYLAGTVYYRFLRDVPKSVQIILVTWTQAKRKAAEWSDLMDVSRMYAAERGFGNYRLLVNENVHDRWLWLDEQIFSLGGSLAEAGSKNDFTVTRIDPVPPNRQQIEDVINSSTELFGPTQQIHP